jgi:uncharacterized membrane protein YphA (DoxX/SURF4 family)
MRDIRRVSVVAVFLVVLLRIAIGWQLLYEGLWKYDQLDTPTPWSAAGYLRNAQGPFREQFRNMTGDPDDLNWLNHDWVNARWDRWRAEFIQFYGLTEKQQQKLDLLLVGPKVVSEQLRTGLKGVQLPARFRQGTKEVDGKIQVILAAAAQPPITDQERDAALAAVPEDAGQPGRELRQAIERVTEKTRQLSFRQRLRATMLGDAERVGATGFQREGTPVYEPKMGTVVDSSEETALLKYGDVQRYKDMLAKYEAELAEANTDYEFDHLAKEWEQIQRLRAKLVQPVMGLERELRAEGWKLLNDQQRSQGRLTYDDSPIHGINSMTMWSLIILGVLLIVGLFTPLAALAAAGMLFMFYLPTPPWPGVPEPPGPEHSFIVNKNLIESIALLGIATLPTGRWFGLDALIARMFRRGK